MPAGTAITGNARIAVHDGAQDDVVGYVTARDLVALLTTDDGRNVRDITRPALFEAEGRRAADVLTDMQQKRIYLTLVLDEAGTIAGLVTLEDLIEELVGKIVSEHDTPVENFRPQADGGVLVRGRVSLHEVNRELGIELLGGRGWTTIAGLAIALAGTIPRPGTRLKATPDVELEVVEASDRQIISVKIDVRRPTG